MTSIGTPLSKSAKKILLLGSGELGKEVAIEAQRFGVEVIAVDRYAHAPAMQVAHRSHVVSMLDGAALRKIIETEKPDLIVPEIEAIATDTLIELEREGFRVERLDTTVRTAWVYGAMSREISRTGRGNLAHLGNPFCLLHGIVYQLRERILLRNNPEAGDELLLIARK